MGKKSIGKIHTYRRGEYRHINYEIWESDGYWAGYVYLNDRQCNIDLVYEIASTPSGKMQYVNYPVSDNPLLEAVDNVVHGGVTLTEISIQHHLPERKLLKIGWDYSHYQSGHTYAERVYADCERAIDAIWEFNPDIKVHCTTVGGYHSLSDGIVRDNGVFISNAGLEARKEWGWN